MSRQRIDKILDKSSIGDNANASAAEVRGLSCSLPAEKVALLRSRVKNNLKNKPLDDERFLQLFSYFRNFTYFIVSFQLPKWPRCQMQAVIPLAVSLRRRNESGRTGPPVWNPIPAISPQLWQWSRMSMFA